MVTRRAAGVESVMIRRLTRLRSDETGGALLVLAFAIIAVTVMAGLTSIAITSGMTATNQRAAQAAQAGMRAAIGTVLAEVNSGGGAARSIEGLEGRTFESSTGGAVSVSTTIESVRYDGATVHLDVAIESLGRLEWTRKGTATLTLAHATSIARIVDGRTVWDYVAQSDKNDYAEQVVALWTVGEMVLYDPSSGTARPLVPNQATIAKDLTGGVATFTAAAAGGCRDGETLQMETRFRVGSERWSGWSNAASASGELPAGQQATMTARTACVRDGSRSAWAVQSASILRSTAVPGAPTVFFDVDEIGTATVMAASDAVPTAGVEVTEQVRVRLDGGAWSTWTSSNTVTLTMNPGQILEAQGRVRVLSATDDSGWIESGVASQSFQG